MLKKLTLLYSKFFAHFSTHVIRHKDSIFTSAAMENSFRFSISFSGISPRLRIEIICFFCILPGRQPSGLMNQGKTVDSCIETPSIWLQLTPIVSYLGLLFLSKLSLNNPNRCTLSRYNFMIILATSYQICLVCFACFAWICVIPQWGKSSNSSDCDVWKIFGLLSGENHLLLMTTSTRAHKNVVPAIA